MIALQAGGIGGSLLPFGFVILIIAVILGYWVYTDANKRGKNNAMLWGLAVGILTLLTLLGGLIALGFYIWTR